MRNKRTRKLTKKYRRTQKQGKKTKRIKKKRSRRVKKIIHKGGGAQSVIGAQEGSVPVGQRCNYHSDCETNVCRINKCRRANMTPQNIEKEREREFVRQPRIEIMPAHMIDNVYENIKSNRRWCRDQWSQKDFCVHPFYTAGFCQWKDNETRCAKDDEKIKKYKENKVGYYEDLRNSGNSGNSGNPEVSPVQEKEKSPEPAEVRGFIRPRVIQGTKEPPPLPPRS